jgi:hypothetical protein
LSIKKTEETPAILLLPLAHKPESQVWVALEFVEEVAVGDSTEHGVAAPATSAVNPNAIADNAHRV